ncbi:cupin domain-containing protein [Kitasatospora sp. NPDC004531]
MTRQFTHQVQQRDVLVVPALLTEPGRDAVDWLLWEQPGRDGVHIHHLYRTEHGAHAFLVRFGPGAHGDLHEHPDHELMLVLAGELVNDNGQRYGVGDLIVEAPGSIHRVDSPGGCTLLVVREAPTRPL